MKTFLRKELLIRRACLSQERQQEASGKLFELLRVRLERFSHVLSFASFSSEINLWPLNEFLLSKKKLYLPRVVKGRLEICPIDSIASDLKLSRLGIYEPITKIAPVNNLENIDCVLVPGLGFDAFKQRLGYGQGHYDQLLNQMPGVLKIGIGFKEQFVETVLPAENHDIPMNELVLV